MLTYEERLDADLGWALEEGGLYFECRGAVHETLQRFTKVLGELQIDYVVVGALAMFFHGFRRFTESIDVIVTSQGLVRIQDEFEPHGFRHFGSDNSFRDTRTGVKIRFLVSGIAKRVTGVSPWTIPTPVEFATEIDGIKVVFLSKLVELKLASGRVPHRLKDLGDVQELVRHLNLPLDFAEQLDPSLRDAYRRIWTDAQAAAGDEY
jgi:hypothetical protein